MQLEIRWNHATYSYFMYFYFHAKYIFLNAINSGTQQIFVKVDLIKSFSKKKYGSMQIDVICNHETVFTNTSLFPCKI